VVRVPRLDPATRYQLTIGDLTTDEPLRAMDLTGSELADDGVRWSLETECTALIVEIQAID